MNQLRRDMINNPRIYQDVFGSIQGGLSQVAGISEKHNAVYGAGGFHRQMVQVCAHGTQVAGCATSLRILAGTGPGPGCGRPRSISLQTLDEMVGRVSGSGITPAGMQLIIHEDAGVNLHITHVRKIMRARGLPPKAPKKVHVNRTGKKAVQDWQYRYNRRVSCLERDGFTVLMQDEAFFIHDVIVGRKYGLRRASPWASRTPGATRRSPRTARSQKTAGSSSGRTRGSTRTRSSGT